MRKARGTKPANFLRLYLEHEYAGDVRLQMLLAAYELRTLIVILDGVDEASGLKQEVEDFVLKTTLSHLTQCVCHFSLSVWSSPWSTFHIYR